MRRRRFRDARTTVAIYARFKWTDLVVFRPIAFSAAAHRSHRLLYVTTILLRTTSISTTKFYHDHELREMFSAHDKDMSGFIGREDVLCMLLAADKDDQKDPAFRTNLRFLIQCIKEADKDGDAKISFDEFKQYIEKATAATK